MRWKVYTDDSKKEIPELEELFKDFEEKGLKVFVFATDKESPTIVKKYFLKNPTSLTVLIDRYLVTEKNMRWMKYQAYF